MRTIAMIQTRSEMGLPPATTTSVSELAEDLRQHLGLCQEILAVVERECQWLRQAETPEPTTVIALKKCLLSRLNQSLERLRQQRLRWQQTHPTERARHPEIAALLRQNQDLIMKVIVLDRENEQALLRRGLVPAAQLPPAQRQRPHFVSELYRHQGARYS
jgi:flagellar biosynthesis/type III secretory pathway chaperone